MSSTKRKYVAALVVVFTFVFASSINAFAQESEAATPATPAATTATPNISEVTIKNFGQMDERFFRGARFVFVDNMRQVFREALGERVIPPVSTGPRPQRMPQVPSPRPV